jgi:hypothetical protein
MWPGNRKDLATGDRPVLQSTTRKARALAIAIGLLGMPLAGLAQDPAGGGAAPAPQPDAAPGGEALPGPPPIPQAELGPVLKTWPVNRGEIGPNERLIGATVLPRDRQGIWVLDFAFKPVRIRTVEVAGKGRRTIHYLYYRVINNTGQPRMFVPQFTLITDTGKRYEDRVLPQAVQVIQARESADIPLLGAVDVVGMIPASGAKQGIDDAVFGVAVWEGVDPAADKFSIYVRGLSDGNQVITPPQGGAPVTLHKTLRLDFMRPGDERDLNEREIRLADPPFEWIYW